MTGISPKTLALLPAVLLTLLVPCGKLAAQFSIDEAPINYNKAKVDDPVSRLQARLDSGKAKLVYDEAHGYLKSVLKNLGVDPSSQALVYSKTSFQLRRISPTTPRSVYFTDDAYVGWVQGGDVVELSAVDPKQGAIFYALPQRKVEKPRFARHTHQCTQCHSSTLTRGVPGHVVRSVFSAPDGQPILRAGTYITDHSSPLKERWGGWYVTGTHGEQRHMGNLLVRRGDDPHQLDTSKGANVTDLGKLIDTSPYLTPHSDIVALMVMEHQTQMHNLITRASYEGRLTLRDENVMNKMLERGKNYRSATTRRRFASSGDRLLKYMLLVDETKLTSPIKGTLKFTERFAARGPRDRKGRSLRDFDLTRRLFKYPCSYLIYSEAFDALPAPVKSHVYRRLFDVLHGRDKSKDFVHLSPVDRKAILEILRDTKKGLPDYWKTKTKAKAKS